MALPPDRSVGGGDSPPDQQGPGQPGHSGETLGLCLVYMSISPSKPRTLNIKTVLEIY